MLSELLPLIKNEDIVEIKKDLLKLHEKEVYSQKIYFEQIRKLDGLIVEILKELLEQEEKHALLLKKLLDKISIPTKEYSMKLEIKNDLKKSISFDIELEKQATKEYQTAINNSSSESMKKFLEHIMEEEFNHIKRLEDFLKEN
ncbi:MAG: ferritin-like domain-containing protein [Candidatus ainarchaeum sp.]|nr:ferritin-like domain-containing protein [Candidatus ainarchaeum sp.]